MNTYRNPLIQDNPADTLSNIGQVITFLQDYHLSSSEPDSPQQSDVHSGLFWVLRSVNQAVEFELARLE